MFKSPIFQLLIIFALIILLTLIGPEEKSLGANVRIVYLHGAWVLSALLALAASGLAGIAGLLLRRADLHRWSQALGRSGMIFWITYLPLSLWAMQTNWNGLFLAEPRMSVAFTFAVVGLLIQVGLAVINHPLLTSAANAVFIAILTFSLSRVDSVMHPPPSPIFNSGNYFLIGYFLSLNLLVLFAAYLVARLASNWQR